MSGNSGPSTGGTLYTINGTGLSSSTVVKFDNSVAIFSSLTSTGIIVITPQHSPGAVDVSVGNYIYSQIFTYIDPPAITSLSPSNGSILGNTTITITGSNLSNATVLFTLGADIFPASIQSNDANTITLNSPQVAVNGYYTVTVKTSAGTSNPLYYTYINDPTTSSISPYNGIQSGGTLITVYGTNFVDGTTVTFNGTNITPTIISSTKLTIISPAYKDSLYPTITITNNAGSIQNNEFYYSTVPIAPSNLIAIPSNQEITLSWSVPYDGGSPIISYTILNSDETIALDNISSTTATITGLINGTTYSYYVYAVNLNGKSSKSVASNFATPSSTIPSSPLNLSAIPSYQKITLSWTAPDNGGSPIINYTILNSDETIALENISSTTAIINGLTNGNTYSYYVYATNINGNSLNSVIATASLTVPDPPTNLYASPLTQKIILSWTASNNQGPPITGYTITDENYYIIQTSTSTTSTITGLTNGNTYSYYVYATNIIGNSLNSVIATASLTVPDPPTNLYASPLTQKIILSWTASNNQGPPITGYTITDENYYIIQTSTSTTSTITGLTNGNTYSYYVYATNIIGNSLNSNLVSSTPNYLTGSTGSKGPKGPQGIKGNCTVAYKYLEDPYYKTFYKNLYNKLYNQLYSQLFNQIYNQSYNQLYNPLYNQLYTQLATYGNTKNFGPIGPVGIPGPQGPSCNCSSEYIENPTYELVYDQLYTELYNNLYNNLYDNEYNKLYNSIYDPLYNQLYNSLKKNNVTLIVNDGTYVEGLTGPNGLIGDTGPGCSIFNNNEIIDYSYDIYDNLYNSLYNKLYSPLYNQMYNQVYDQIYLQLFNQLFTQLNN